MIERGRLYWAHLDKRRPAVVMSINLRNERASDVTVVPLSSRLRGGPWHVQLRKGEAGLTVESVVKCEQITTLSKRDVEPGPIGPRLSAARMREIETAVLDSIGIVPR